jgi:predicted Fe-Mo cluster-binding NifX family protein
LSSELDSRFGRASYFVVADTDSGELSAHDNLRNVRSAHGADARAAQDLVELGVEGVITGNIRPNAAGVLRAGNVKVYKQTWGTVRDAIEQLKAGRLKELADAGKPGP